MPTTKSAAKASAVKEAKSQKVYQIISEDGELVLNNATEAQMLKLAQDQYKEYVKDEVDPEYIAREFSKGIQDIKDANRWQHDIGNVIVEMKSNEALRILTRMFNDNSFLYGKMERTEYDYFDQGSWNFQIKILDIDPETQIARVQLTFRKMCPSGIWDNGIEVVEKPLIPLYDNTDLDTFVRKIIRNHFRYKKCSGRDYRILRWAQK